MTEAEEKLVRSCFLAAFNVYTGVSKCLDDFKAIGAKLPARDLQIHKGIASQAVEHFMTLILHGEVRVEVELVLDVNLAEYSTIAQAAVKDVLEDKSVPNDVFDFLRLVGTRAHRALMDIDRTDREVNDIIKSSK